MKDSATCSFCGVTRDSRRYKQQDDGNCFCWDEEECWLRHDLNEGKGREASEKLAGYLANFETVEDAVEAFKELFHESPVNIAKKRMRDGK